LSTNEKIYEKYYITVRKAQKAVKLDIKLNQYRKEAEKR
jgi:hypothetical protein